MRGTTLADQAILVRPVEWDVQRDRRATGPRLPVHHRLARNGPGYPAERGPRPPVPGRQFQERGAVQPGRRFRTWRNFCVNVLGRLPKAMAGEPDVWHNCRVPQGGRLYDQQCQEHETMDTRRRVVRCGERQISHHGTDLIALPVCPSQI